jgi:polysaccharide export outer membrane protein
MDAPSAKVYIQGIFARGPAPSLAPRPLTRSGASVKRLFQLLLAATLVFSGGALRAQSPAQPPASDAAQADALQPGDQIRITVWRKAELSGDFLVAQDGTILHPLYRSVQVAGVPMPEVRSRVQAVLQQYENNAEFVVQPLYRVAVGGEVRLPSLYTVPGQTTVTQAVAMAGGVSPRGALSRVVLVRGRTSTTLDLTRPELGAGETTVRSGDQIVVPRTRSIFRDYLAPAGSITAGVAALLRLIINN